MKNTDLLDGTITFEQLSCLSHSFLAYAVMQVFVQSLPESALEELAEVWADGIKKSFIGKNEASVKHFELAVDYIRDTFILEKQLTIPITGFSVSVDSEESVN